MNDLISVIVPVYNVENYIVECISSIINQTYKNIEIIVVNDGTKDSSIEKLTSINDNRIVIYTKENGGLSSARNYGLNFAHGKYVIFIDSDDYLDVHMLEVLYTNLINSNSDISICGVYKKYEDHQELNQEKLDFQVIEDLRKIEYIYDFQHYGVGVWNKLFKRELLWKDMFPLGKLSEDYFVMYKVFYCAQKVCYDSTPLYYYRQRRNSITSRKKTSFDVLDAMKLYLDFAKNEEPILLNSAIHAITYSRLGVYNTILKNGDAIEYKKALRKEIIGNYRMAYSYEKNKSRRLQLFIFKYFRFFYYILFKIYKYKQK